MLMKIDCLSGALLDYAVSVTRGFSEGYWDEVSENYYFTRFGGKACHTSLDCFQYLEEESIILKLIVTEGIAVRQHPDTKIWYAIYSDDIGGNERCLWNKRTIKGGIPYGEKSYQVHKRQQRYDDANLLIAVLRCFVAKHHGEHIKIPDTVISLPALQEYLKCLV